MALLEVRALQTGYGKLQVLWSVDLDINARESVVLLGANGAGKTTLLRAIVGLLPAWHGSIRLSETDITHQRSDQRIRSGIAFMSELGVFPTLSIIENLRMGGYFLPARTVKARAQELFGMFPDLAKRPRALAASLSGGQRKMLGMAKALMSKPSLLILDEPSAGVAPVFVKQMVSALDTIRTQGTALLVAEQNVAFLPLADRGFVLDGGRISFSGTQDELMHADAVRAAYFGVQKAAAASDS